MGSEMCIRDSHICITIYSSFLKNGIKKTKQAIKKKMLPNIDQKWPILEIQNPIADIIKSTHPMKFICLFFIIYLTSLISINNILNIKMFRL